MAGTRRLSQPLTTAAERLAGETCVVALSGGPDSAALGWLAANYASEARFVHVNHGLPGSAGMQAAARLVAAALGYEVTVIVVQIPDGPSLEANARAVRYEALVGALEPGEVLATGHTADDDAESVLINLGRGTGLWGLAGIPERRGRIMRPLLGVRRYEVLDLATSESLPYAVDPANADTAMLRNRIRHDVLPVYEKAMERDPIPLLARTATHARQASAAVTALGSSVPVAVQDGVSRTPLVRLLLESPAVQAEVARRLVLAARPPYPPTASEVDRLLEVAGGGTGTELEGGLVVTRSRTNLLVGPTPTGAPEPVQWEHENVEFDGWVLRRRQVAAPARRLASAMACLISETDHEMFVRSVLPSDALAVPGGTKAALAAIAEAGTPRPARSRHPVVTIGGRMAWIPGVRAGGPSWEDRASGGYLLLDVIEEGPWK